MLIKPASTSSAATDLTAIASDVKSSADETYNLGSAAKRWLRIFVDYLTDGNSVNRLTFFGGATNIYKDGSAGGGTSVSHSFDTNASFVAGDKLLQLKNNGTEKLAADYTGTLFPGSDYGADFGTTSRRFNGVFLGAIKDSSAIGRYVPVDNSSTTYRDGISSPGSGSVAHALSSYNTYVAGGKIVSIQNSGVEKASFDYAGRLSMDASDSSGTPGAATINKPSGRAAIASGASSAVITNSLVTASSVVRAQLETSAAGVGGLVVVPGAGSFTVTSVSGTGVATNTTAIAKFSFVVFN